MLKNLLVMDDVNDEAFILGQSLSSQPMQPSSPGTPSGRGTGRSSNIIIGPGTGDTIQSNRTTPTGHRNLHNLRSCCRSPLPPLLSAESWKDGNTSIGTKTTGRKQTRPTWNKSYTSINPTTFCNTKENYILVDCCFFVVTMLNCECSTVKLRLYVTFS
jgi:hypothetical protein